MLDWSTLLEQVQEVFQNLFNSHALMDVMRRPGFMAAAFVVLNIVVFVETGLLIGFFLPGDSLLVTAGLVCYVAEWNLPLLLITLTIAAIAGDSLGYWIGYRSGPAVFTREDSILFHKKHLQRAQEFYDRHGGKTIILARFIPIVRTFAPLVAGVGRMDYRRFLAYNVMGGVLWVFSMVLLGYALTPILDPLLAPLFGEGVRVQDHVEKVIILVVLASISPGIVAWLRSRFVSRGVAHAEPPVVASQAAD